MKIKIKKSLSIFLAAMMLFSLSSFAAPVSAYAKSGKATTKAVYLKHNTTYSSYDLNGDGKADKIKVKYFSYTKSGSGSGEARIYINGKKRRTLSGGASTSVRLIAPTKKKVFLVVEYHFKGGTAEAYLYRYKSSKIKRINSRSIYAPFAAGKITKVTSSSFYVKATTTKYDNGMFMNAYNNVVSFKIGFSFNGYKITRKSKYLKAYDNFFLANKDFVTSTTKTYHNYNGVKMVAGEYLYVLQAYAYGDYEYSIQVQDDYGYKGWVFDYEYDWDNPYLY